jgi:UDP-glucose 4-epimerase
VFGPVHSARFHQVTRLCRFALAGETRDPDREVHAEDAGDYTYVKDCARALTMLQLAPSLPNRVYNVGAGTATTNQRVVDLIKQSVPESKLQLNPGRGQGRGVGWRENVYMDISRLKSDIGYEPQWPMEKAIPDYIAWLRTNED